MLKFFDPRAIIGRKDYVLAQLLRGFLFALACLVVYYFLVFVTLLMAHSLLKM